MLLIVSAVGVSLYLYVYRDHRNIATETADFTVTVNDLKKEFIENDSLAYMKYKDKTIQLSAKVTSIDTENNAIVVDEKLYATFMKAFKSDLAIGKQITIKGRFLGYDDLIEEFKIDQVTIVK